MSPSKFEPSRPMSSATAWRSSWLRGRRADQSAMSIAIHPVSIAMGQKPVPCDNSKTVEHKTHGLSDAHQTIDRTHFGQHMRRVGSLTLSLLEPALFFEDSQHRIQ